LMPGARPQSSALTMRRGPMGRLTQADAFADAFFQDN